MSIIRCSHIDWRVLRILSKVIAMLPFDFPLKTKVVRRQSLLASETDPFQFYENMMTWINKANIAKLLKGEIHDSELMSFRKFFDDARNSPKNLEFMANLFDIQTYLPGDLLTKVDMASMSFGLEVRSPFLDSKVANFGLSLPDKYRIQPTQTKILLKELARKKVPLEIVDRPKQGFGIPRANWLRGELKENLNEVLSRSNSNLSTIVNMTYVEEKLLQFNSGNNDDTEIWALYMLGSWAKAWL
jgi:asparagine synthase (glutamine-hydrolysing)